MTRPNRSQFETSLNCPRCGYDLRAQVEERCPECSLHYDVQALRDVRNRSATSILSHQLDAMPFLLAGVAFEAVSLLGVGPAALWVAVAVFLLLRSLRGWTLQDMRSEFDDDLPSSLFSPRRLTAQPLWVALLIPMIAAAFSKLGALMVSAGALGIGLPLWWKGLWVRQKFLETNQDVALTSRERIALRRAHYINTTLAVAGVIL